jgi:hypothetical protein
VASIGGTALTPALSHRPRGRGGRGAAIYGSFMEGFDTPDLMEAKGLLEELAESA